MHILFFIFIAILLFVIYILASKEERKLKSKYEPRGKLEQYCSDEKDRRRCRRFDTELDVKYKILKSLNPHSATSSKDISGVGISILVYEILAKDSLVEVQISVPGSKEPATVKGRVAWCEGCEGKERFDKNGKRAFLIGIEFMENIEKQKNKLNDYINSHLLKNNNEEKQ